MNFGRFGVLGDSYSTFEGCVPDGYAVYYKGEKQDESGVHTVEETWWGGLAAAGAGTVGCNCSFSGSTICNTGYDARYCPDTSFIGRMKTYFSGKETYDTIFVFGGTNDTWANSPLGEDVVKPWADYTDEELRSVLPAIRHMVGYLTANNPGTRLVLLINTELRPEIAGALLRAARDTGAACVTFTHIDKISGHPTAVGMKDIREQILHTLH